MLEKFRNILFVAITISLTIQRVEKSLQLQFTQHMCIFWSRMIPVDNPFKGTVFVVSSDISRRALPIYIWCLFKPFSDQKWERYQRIFQL